MQVRKFHLVPAVAVTAVLVLAVTLLLARGLADALVLITVVAMLAGAYMLRRYARAQVLYRRADDPTASRRDARPVPATVGDREGAA